MKKKVVVYTSDTCGYCTAAKEYLNSINCEYEEKNVNRDAEARKELMKQGFMGVPVILVDDEIIQGFDKERLQELLENESSLEKEESVEDLDVNSAEVIEADPTTEDSEHVDPEMTPSETQDKMDAKDCD